MKTTYVSIIYFGSYEDKDTNIVYAGEDYDKAKEAAIVGAMKVGGELRNADVQHWTDGVRTKEETVYE